MRPDTILVDRSPGETRIALLAGDAVVQLFFDRDHMPAPVEGAIYAGRVASLNLDMNAAFVDIGLDQAGFLGFNDARGLNEPGAELEVKAKSIKHLLHEGERVLVQADRAALAGKGPRLTRRLRLESHHMALKRGEEGLKFPRDMARPERDRLAELYELLPIGVGVELLPAAGGAAYDMMEAELMGLLELNSDLNGVLADAKLPSTLVDAPSPLDKALAMAAPDARLIVNRAGILEADLAGDAEVWSGGQPLFQAFGVEVVIDEVLQPQMPVPGGGRLIISETPALTAIDVDTAKAHANTPAKLAKAVNTAAVKAVFYAMRLRNLGGQVLVDLLPTRSKKDRQDLLTLARQLAGSDIGDVHVLGYSALGLLEITRRRTGPSVLHQLTDLIPGGYAGGRHLSPATIGLIALRTLDQNPTPMPKLAVSGKTRDALKGELSQAVREAEARLGTPIQVVSSDNLPEEGFTLL